MSMTFHYKKLDRPEKYLPAYAPVVPLTLIGNKEIVDVVGLLDSGADVSAISKDLADILGLDLSRKPDDVGGIGGKAKAVLSKVSIKIGKGHENYSFGMKVYVVYSDLEDDFPILIGRVDFFERFKITFDEQSKKVILKKV